MNELLDIFLLIMLLIFIFMKHFLAITISVLLCGQCRITLGICIVFMQLFGSFIGAMLVRTLILEAAYIDIFRGSILDESNATLVNRIQVPTFSKIIKISCLIMQ